MYSMSVKLSGFQLARLSLKDRLVLWEATREFLKRITTAYNRNPDATK